MQPTATQIAAINQGSVNAANAANNKAGVINGYVPGGSFVNPSPTPSGTLNATFPQPAAKTIPAPVVVTSDAANDHITQMQTSSNQSNADIANNTAIQNTPPATPSANGTSTPQNGTTTTPSATTPATPDNSDPGGYDAQINDILDNLTNGSTTAAPTELQQNTLNDDNSGVTQDQQDQQTVANSIDSMNSGTYPLSASEQAQVAQVATGYTAALGNAQKYAAIVQAGATVAGAQSGMQEYSPSINLGNIQNAINAGNQKIQTINAQILDAQGKLTTALQNQDYKAATTLYSQISDNIKARTDEITAIQKSIDDETANMRDNAKTALTTLVSEQKLSSDNSIAAMKADATAKQNAVTNAYKAGMLSVAEKKLADTEIANQQKNALANGPAVTMTATGADPTAQQQFLGALPGGANGAEATYIKGLADYSFSPTSSPQKQYAGASGLTQAQALTLAKQYDPSYNEANYAAAAKYVASLKSTSGNTTGSALGSAAKAINHLSALLTSMKSLGNTGISLGIPFTGLSVNSAKNAAENIFSSNTQTNLATANTEAGGVADELAKFFKGTGATDVQSIEDWKKSVNVNATPAEQQGLQDGALKLLTGQLDVAYSQYQSALGKPPADPLVPMETLTKLKNMGVDITPYVGTTVTSLTSFHDASAQNAQLMDQLVKAQPNLANDPDAMLQTLTQNGIHI